MDNSNSQEILKAFTRSVVNGSKSKLKAKNKNVSNALTNSIDSEFNVSKNSFSISFKMEDYGKYQDQGVSGVKQKYNTPFGYKAGPQNAPPPKAFDKWIVKRGLAPRDKGKFTSRKSLQFALSRKIQRDGIKPSKFFTEPFEKAFEKLPDDFVKAFGLDVESFLKFTLKK